MLARMQKSLKEKDQGFTLIELLVVIVIIGILAAIAIPLFLNQQKKGVDAGVKSDLKQLANLEESYYVDSAAYMPADDSTAATKAEAVFTEFKRTDSDTKFVIKLGKAGVGGYCITGVNSTDGSGKTFYYDSVAGGLKTTAAEASGACVTANQA